MKKEDLFDTLGDINNQYIKEAHMNNKRKNNFFQLFFAFLCLFFHKISY